jgi:hypothetical protein
MVKLVLAGRCGWASIALGGRIEKRCSCEAWNVSNNHRNHSIGAKYIASVLNGTEGRSLRKEKGTRRRKRASEMTRESVSSS